jgi:hypothetical protein
MCPVIRVVRVALVIYSFEHIWFQVHVGKGYGAIVGPSLNAMVSDIWLITCNCAPVIVQERVKGQYWLHVTKAPECECKRYQELFNSLFNQGCFESSVERVRENIVGAG